MEATNKLEDVIILRLKEDLDRVVTAQRGSPEAMPSSRNQEAFNIMDTAKSSTISSRTYANAHDQFDIILSYTSEIEHHMLQIAEQLRQRFGPNCVVHGLMCKPGEPWDAGYFLTATLTSTLILTLIGVQAIF